VLTRFPTYSTVVFVIMELPTAKFIQAQNDRQDEGSFPITSTRFVRLVEICAEQTCGKYLLAAAS